MKKLLCLTIILTTINCHAISVGDSYGGGTVFCVTNNPDLTKCKTEGSGYFGLIMANEDQANLEINEPETGITWSSNHSITDAQSNDDGIANTLAIINKRPNDDATNNAAYLCRDYQNNTGWYLPSKNELNKMYTYARNNNLIGNNCTGSQPGGVQCLIGSRYGNIYWSSTEFADNPSNVAWLQAFSYGGQFNTDKTNLYFGVRAVRVFNSLALNPFNTLEMEKVHGKRQRRSDLFKKSIKLVKYVNHLAQTLAAFKSPDTSDNDEQDVARDYESKQDDYNYDLLQM